MKQNYQVFISHAGEDTWVARQIAEKVRRQGSGTYLDYERMEAGADFNTEILGQIRNSRELVALLTPAAIDKPYVWLEIGGMLTLNRRVVALLYGLSVKQIQNHKKNLSMLTDKHLLHLNEADKYFAQLRARIKRTPKP